MDGQADATAQAKALPRSLWPSASLSCALRRTLLLWLWLCAWQPLTAQQLILARDSVALDEPLVVVLRAAAGDTIDAGVTAARLLESYAPLPAPFWIVRQRADGETLTLTLQPLRAGTLPLTLAMAVRRGVHTRLVALPPASVTVMPLATAPSPPPPSLLPLDSPLYPVEVGYGNAVAQHSLLSDTQRAALLQQQAAARRFPWLQLLGALTAMVAMLVVYHGPKGAAAPPPVDDTPALADRLCELEGALQAGAPTRSMAHRLCGIARRLLRRRYPSLAGSLTIAECRQRLGASAVDEAMAPLLAALQRCDEERFQDRDPDAALLRQIARDLHQLTR